MNCPAAEIEEAKRKGANEVTQSKGVYVKVGMGIVRKGKKRRKMGRWGKRPRSQAAGTDLKGDDHPDTVHSTWERDPLLRSHVRQTSVNARARATIPIE